VPVHPYLVKSLIIHYHIIFGLILYTFKCAVVGKITIFLSFFLSFYETIPGIAQCSTKKITKKYSNNYYFVSLEIYGILYMKKVTEFREIPRNFTDYMTRNSGEFRRNFSQFRTEYGIDGSKKTGGIPCGRNSVDTLLAARS
jgi:hypothetical protein